MRRIAVPLTVIFAAFVFLLLIITADSSAHYKPGTHNAIHAIQTAFCGKANRSCVAGNEAIRVAICESGSYWDRGIPHMARNGQYRGMMQMGASERELFGHGPDPWSQARAAHRYYVSSGRDWSPWECKP